MLNIQKYWIDLGSPPLEEYAEVLKTELGINSKKYEDENLFVFNYDQVESPKYHPIVKECRGIIIDTDFNIICQPFKRFFNINECKEETESFNFKDAFCFEKADGSLIKVYYWNNSWRVATRGTAFAESEGHSVSATYSDLVLRAFGVENLESLSKKLDMCLVRGCTYLFEYTSPFNRVVTPYTQDCMIFLGVGNEKVHPSALQSTSERLSSLGLNVRQAKLYNLNSAEEIVNNVNTLENLEEGFVCWDFENDLRIKVKSNNYVVAHLLRGSGARSPKRICQIIFKGEMAEYLAYFKEDYILFKPYLTKLEALEKEMSHTYDKYKDIPNQKDFVEKVSGFTYKFVLFSARRENRDPIEYFHSMTLNKKVKTLLAEMNK